MVPDWGSAPFGTAQITLTLWPRLLKPLARPCARGSAAVAGPSFVLSGDVRVARSA